MLIYSKLEYRNNPITNCTGEKRPYGFIHEKINKYGSAHLSHRASCLFYAARFHSGTSRHSFRTLFLSWMNPQGCFLLYRVNCVTVHGHLINCYIFKKSKENKQCINSASSLLQPISKLRTFYYTLMKIPLLSTQNNYGDLVSFPHILAMCNQGHSMSK